MTIETRYNVGDEVWFMFDGEPLNGKILRIGIDTISIRVVIGGNGYRFTRDADGFDLYPTKEELLKSL